MSNDIEVVSRGAVATLDVVLGRVLKRIPYLRSHASYIRKHRVGDVEFVIPIVNGQGQRHFWRFENETFAIMRALHAQCPGTFVDIGANIGQTLIKLKAIDRGTKYIGFEPSPGCCSYLDLLIQANDFSDCTVLPVGASDARSVLHFYFTHSTDAAATTVAGFWTGQNRKPLTRTILVERADALIQQVATERVGIIKIDVEGGELEALAGLAATVAEYRPPILMEVLPASCDLDARHPDTKDGVKLRLERMTRLVDLLDEMHLVSYRMAPKGTLTATRDFDSDIYVPELTNYLLIPASSELDMERLSGDFQLELTQPESQISGPAATVTDPSDCERHQSLRRISGVRPRRREDAPE